MFSSQINDIPHLENVHLKLSVYHDSLNTCNSMNFFFSTALYNAYASDFTLQSAHFKLMYISLLSKYISLLKQIKVAAVVQLLKG